jgi:hypothetical protein
MQKVPTAIFSAFDRTASLAATSPENREFSRDAISEDKDDSPLPATLRITGVATEGPEPITKLISTFLNNIEDNTKLNNNNNNKRQRHTRAQVRYIAVNQEQNRNQPHTLQTTKTRKKKSPYNSTSKLLHACYAFKSPYLIVSSDKGIHPGAVDVWHLMHRQARCLDQKVHHTKLRHCRTFLLGCRHLRIETGAGT